MSTEKARQQVVPRKRAASTRRMAPAPTFDWSKIRERAGLIARIGAAIMAVVVLVVLYQRVMAWPAFHLRNVEVSGNHRMSSGEIERMVRQHMSATLLSTSLTKLQDQLQSSTWIKRAQITRILPDTLRIQVEERKPLALARFEGQAAVWISDDAVVLGEYDAALDKDIPPLVFGFNKEKSDDALAENRERVELYKHLVWSLDSGNAKYTDKVEEIDLSNLKDVRLQLSPGPVEVDLGDRDFRTRLARAITILDALRRRDLDALKDYKFLDTQILEDPGRIRFISVVHPTQIAIRSSKVTQTRASSDKVARAEEER